MCLVPCLFAQSICGIAEQIKTELEEFRVSDILRLGVWAGDARVSDCTKLLMYLMFWPCFIMFVFLPSGGSRDQFVGLKWFLAGKGEQTRL